MKSWRDLLAVLLIVGAVREVIAQDTGANVFSAGAGRIEGEYIVVLKDGATADVAQRVARVATAHGVTPEIIWSDALQGFAVKTSEARGEALSQHPDVAYVEENAEWYLAAATPTNVDPKTCDPIAGGCTPVTDNRLWHLDRSDQNVPTPTNTFSYCTDGQRANGQRVTVYVVDTGVNKHHQEFFSGQVQPGFNAAGDFMPADDPCLGFALPPVEEGLNRAPLLEKANYLREVGHAGHGTAVASVVGGRRVGVAKQTSIVPVKVSRCDRYSARSRRPSQHYQLNETMFVPTASNGSAYRYYRAIKAGVTHSSEAVAAEWPSTTDTEWCDDGTTVPNTPVAQCTGVVWKTMAQPASGDTMTTQMLITGVNWIMSSSNPGPKANAVVTFSTYRVRTEPGAMGASPSAEASIRSLLTGGLTVIASANNQNGNACDTVPGLLSANNPTTSLRSDVITVGGSMITNRPWSVDISDVASEDIREADGARANDANGSKGTEPAHDPTKPVAEARWICGAGDSAPCSNDTPTETVDPASYQSYPGFNAGSNAGPCVTVFAPAKNIAVASVAAADAYRDPRVAEGNASGTSWAAPLVAGFAGRILEQNPTFLAPDVRAMLLANSAATLDPATLSTFDHNSPPNEITGTPNKVVRLGDVNITSEPQSTPAAESGATTLTVQASGTAAVSYQWYRVNDTFRFDTYTSGADATLSSTQIVGATLSSYAAPQDTAVRAYWVRVTNDCGSADSRIAVVVPPPASAPTSVTATLGPNGSVTITWSAASGTVEKYEVQRKIAGESWTPAQLVANTVFTFQETPTAPGGIVVYRVRSVTGETYLPAWNLAGKASNNDFVNLAAPGYEALPAPPIYLPIRAQHLVELRQAVNALSDAVGASRQFTSEEVQLTALKGTTVKAADFTSLMSKANAVRTHALLAIGAAAFSATPAQGAVVNRGQLQTLRDALR